MSDARWHVLEKIVKRLGTKSAQLAYYGSALGAIALVGGAQLPESLTIVAGGVGINLLSNLIEDILKGEDLLDEDIRARAESAINQSDIANLLTKQDFLQGYGRLIQRLDAQKDASQTILIELRNGFSNVATAEQVEELKRLILALSPTPSTTSKPSVFISYRRSDGGDFAQHLHDSLEKEGVDAWLDVRDMPSGDTFITQIGRAIERADYFLLVATPQAIESDYCRDEWKKALEKYKPIIPLMLMGDYADLPQQEAFAHLNDARDFRDDAKYDEQLAQLIKQIHTKPTLPGDAKGVPNLPLHYLPRPELLDTLRQLLTAHKTTVLTSPAQRVGVQGMAGVGKSVLAAAISRDYFVRRTFKDGVFWLTFGTEPHLYEVWRQLANYLGHPYKNFNDCKEAQDFFEEQTRDKECLLILDDLWQSGHADAFLHLGEKCRIFVTSRQSNILAQLETYPHTIGILSDIEARELLKRVAKVNALPETAEGIIQACGNLPLALAMIGAMIAGKSLKYWKDALEALEEADLEEISVSSREYRHPNLFAALKVSVEALEPDLRESYKDFAIFPDDVAIPEDVLLTFWKPLTGRNVRRKLDELVNRNLLIRIDDNSLTLHDLQLVYLRKETKDSRVRHNRLLDQYNPDNVAWQKICDHYLWYHLAYHLKEAGKDEELHKLLTASPDWMETKYINCVGDSAYVADLELAMKSYKDPLSAEGLVKWVELNTARQVVNARVGIYNDHMLRALVYMGREQEALNHVYLRPNPNYQFEGMVAIWTIAQEKEQNFISFDTLRQMAQSIPDATSRTNALSSLANKLAQVGNYEQARIVAQSIDSHAGQERALASLATTLIQVEDYEQARIVTQTIADLNSQANDWGAFRWDSLKELTLSFAKAGAYRQAQEVAQSIPDAHHQTNILSKLAEQLIQMGAYEQAQEAAQRIPNAYQQADALCKLAARLTQNGDSRAPAVLGLVLESAQSLPDGYSKSSVLINLTEQLAQIGDSRAPAALNLALDAAQSIADTDYRTRALGDLAKQLMQVADSRAPAVLNLALDAAQNLPDGYWKNSALSDLSWLLAQMGDPQQAQVVAQSIPDADYRARALSKLAAQLVQVADSRAPAVLNLALDAAQNLPDGWPKSEKSSTLSSIAEQLVQVGDYQQALEVTQSISNVRSQTGALIKLVEQLVQVGDYQQAQAVAQSIREATDRVSTLSKLAEQIAQSGDYQQAQEVAQSISDEGWQSSALSKVVRCLIQAGDYQQAQAVAQSIRNTSSRVSALSDLAAQFAQMGDSRVSALLSLALEAAQTISDDVYWKSEALINISGQFAQLGDYQQAQAVAKSISDADYRVRALGKLAAQLAQMGDYQQALSLLNIALNAVESINNNRNKSSALSNLAKQFAQLGAYQQAREVAQSISDEYSKSSTLSDIAENFAINGAYRQAQEFAQSIPDTRSRVSALSKLAEQLAQVGDNQAQTVLNLALAGQTNTHAHTQAKALIELAGRFAQVGGNQAQVFFDQAFDAAQNIPREDSKSSTLSDLAWQLTRVGAYQQAQVAVQSIPAFDTQARTLARLVAHAARAGDYEQAQKMVQVISAFDEKAQAVKEQAKLIIFYEEARHIAQAGDYERARKMIQSISKTTDQAWALKELAEQLTQAGAYEQAQEVAQSIPFSDEKVQALSALAVQLAQVGDNRSQKVFSLALDAAQSITDVRDQANALSKLVGQLAQAGDNRSQKVFSQVEKIISELAEQALEVAKGMHEPAYHDAVLKLESKCLAQARNYKKALEVALSISYAQERASALRELARQLMEVGAYQQAQEVAQNMHDASDQASVLRELARLLTEAKDRRAQEVFDQALHATQSITDAYWKLPALRELAGQLTQRHQYCAAFNIFGMQTIEDMFHFLASLQSSIKVYSSDVPDLWQQILLSALQIICWYRKDYILIRDILKQG
jgi:tetratricopeptide (TPR) repeat protein